MIDADQKMAICPLRYWRSTLRYPLEFVDKMKKNCWAIESLGSKWKQKMFGRQWQRNCIKFVG
jgi:hypothetical protein